MPFILLAQGFSPGCGIRNGVQGAVREPPLHYDKEVYFESSLRKIINQV